MSDDTESLMGPLRQMIRSCGHDRASSYLPIARRALILVFVHGRRSSLLQREVKRRGAAAPLASENRCHTPSLRGPSARGR